MQHTFSIREIIRRSWATLMHHKTLSAQLVGTLLVLQILQWVLAVAQGMKTTWFYLLLNILLNIVAVVIGIGFNAIFLKLAKGEPAGYRDIVQPLRTIVRYLAVSLVVAVGVLIGFALLIVPGVYLLLRYLFAPYMALDTDSDALTIISRSAKLTRGIKGKLALLLLVLVVINILGFLALGVGLLVTIPLSALVMMHTYLSLKHRVEEAA
ncbi:MAG: hypothetical protein JWO43_435 [Candidatus Adlerbacteria bacterium]|nr:hypothetical protein [Candidatus Adlerbacteria bacterium]